jgi:hypothetical protein
MDCLGRCQPWLNAVHFLAGATLYPLGDTAQVVARYVNAPGFSHGSVKTKSTEFMYHIKAGHVLWVITVC